MRVGAVEGGGTTFRAAVYDTDLQQIVAKTVVPTTSPEETISKVAAFLRPHGSLERVGFACFGPLSFHTGSITSTPKPGWRDSPVVDLLLKELPQTTVVFETDVNAPAVSEARVAGVHSCCYMTVGTGVGIGVVVAGQPVHGLVHPEGGHMLISPHAEDTARVFTGTCPFHKGCLEGMTSTKAIAARLGRSVDQLHEVEDSHPVWTVIAYYLAVGCMNVSLMVSPEKIILGGGVLQRAVLYPMVRGEFLRLMNGYVRHSLLADEAAVSNYISEPARGSDAGLWGAIELALPVTPVAAGRQPQTAAAQTGSPPAEN